MEHKLESKNHPFIFNPFAAKINEVTNPYPRATQFIQKLRFMSRLIGRVSLQLHDDFLFHKEVSQIIPNNDAFELNLYSWLKLHPYATREEFNLHRPLINFFEESEAKDVMNLKRGPNQMLRYRLE